MNKPNKYVRMPNEDQLIQLKDLMKNSHSARVRMRSHSIVLSSEGYSIDKIADIYHVDRDSVSSWIDRWEQSGTEGLYDKPRSGKPPALTESETEIVKRLIKEHPHSPRMILAKISEKTGKIISISTLKRIVKKANLRWKRMRKSVKNRREQEQFEKARKDIEKLREQHQTGKIDLFYFDESGFSTGSCVPYAYQPVGEITEIGASDRRRMNVLGFMSPDNRFESFCFNCNIDTGIVVRCFDEFLKSVRKKLLLSLITPLFIAVRNLKKKFLNGKKRDCLSDIYQNILPN
jgi:transposase